MPIQLTTPQILQLVPKPTTIKSGKTLGIASKWLSVERNDKAIWGTIKGSGKNPYQTIVDLHHEPAYKCSCSSRDIPCKHAVGLMLIYAQDENQLAQTSAPDWVEAWMTTRANHLAKSASPKPIDREAQAKRAAKRQTNIIAGLDELDLWLCDLIHAGLATLQGKPRAFYETTAKRMIDAQAPALADKIRTLATIPASGEGWEAKMLAELAGLHLIIEGFRRFDELEPTIQADLRTVVGWSLQTNELANEPPIDDTWLVLGTIVQAQEKLHTKRIWLYGLKTEKVALLLDFAHGGASFEHNFVIGSAFHGELVFYPGNYPMRAIVRKQIAHATPPDTLPGYANLSESIDVYAAALTQNLWINPFPVAFQAVIPSKYGKQWVVVDAEHNELPLDSHNFYSQWQMFAISGGKPIWLFGEWNGHTLLPLTVSQHNSLIGLV